LGDERGTVYVVGANGLVQWLDGTAWGAARYTKSALYAIGGTGPSDLFAVGTSGAIVRKTSGWSLMHRASLLSAVAPLRPAVMLAAGDDGIIYRMQGDSWARVPFKRRHIYGIWARGPDDLLLVTNAGYVVHYDGTTFKEQRPATQDLYGIWGASAASGLQAVAVGANGTVLHLVDGAWVDKTDKAITAAHLRRAWGSGPSDVFVVGDKGTILHFDGTSWSVQASNVTTNLTDVWGRSDSEVYAVGASSTLLQYDGSRWSRVDTKLSDYFRSVIGVGARELYIGSNSSKAHHFDGQIWTTQPFTMSGGAHALAHDDSAGFLYAVGTNSSLFRQQR
jgi:hypothetical protein